MLINNVELDFSLTDVDNLERIENAYKKIIEDAGKVNTNLSYIESLKNECRMTREFFNEVFGEGTDLKLFGEKNDYEVCMDALTKVMECFEENQKRLENKYEKYNANRVKKA